MKINKCSSRKSIHLSPLLDQSEPVEWSFSFKFNAEEMPGNIAEIHDRGLFDAPGIIRPKYEGQAAKFSRHYLCASSLNAKLRLGQGKDVLGSSLDDPLGATFGQVYLAAKPPYFVVWNDQFYGQPINSGESPWGHSKGILAWDENGEGFVLQVSTPSWPGAGNKRNPRQGDGNTLGFVKDDNIEVSQHFFSLKLRGDDVSTVLKALYNASVLTEPDNPVLVNNGGPEHIQALVKSLGVKQKGKKCFNNKLSSGVRLISKPSALHVPPWQLVSAELGGVDLRVASWWAHPKIYSTSRENSTPGCWDKSLAQPGAVEIATSGNWPGIGSLGFKGGPGAKYNHAKFGVSTSSGTRYCIFGDMNQQGSLLKEHAHSSQNGRGGLFFVLDDEVLFDSMTALLKGDSASISKNSESTENVKCATS